MKGKIMKVLVIGSALKKEEEIRLVDEIKKRDVLTSYIPITSIVVELNEVAKIHFKNKSIYDYNFVIPFVDRRNIDIFRYVLDMLNRKNIYTITSGRTVFLYQNYYYFLTLLRENKINIPKTIIAKSKKALLSMIDVFNYPVIIKIPGEKAEIFVASKESIGSILDTIEIMYMPIIVQEIGEQYDKIKILVIGENIYALREVEKKGEEKYEKYRLRVKEREVVEKVSKLIKSKFFVLNALIVNEEGERRFEIKDFSLYPEIKLFVHHYSDNIYKNFAISITKEKNIIKIFQDIVLLPFTYLWRGEEKK